MPASAADAMVKAVGDEVVRAIVTDHYRGIVPPARWWIVWSNASGRAIESLDLRLVRSPYFASSLLRSRSHFCNASPFINSSLVGRKGAMNGSSFTRGGKPRWS